MLEQLEKDPTSKERRTYKVMKNLAQEAKRVQDDLERDVTVPLLDVFTTPKERRHLRSLLGQTLFALTRVSAESQGGEEAKEVVRARASLIRGVIRKVK